MSWGSHPQTQVLAAAVLFGTTGTALALGPAGASPVGVGAARILIGALGLWTFALLASRGARRAPVMTRQGQWLAWLSGAGVALYQLCFFAAVDLTGVAVGTVVAIGSGPAVAGLLGRLVNAESLTRTWAVATGMACAGIALLVAGGGGDATVDPVGVLLAVLSGTGYTSYTVLSKPRLDLGASPERVMSGAFGRGAILLIPALVIAGGGWLAEPGGIALALYLGLIPTALAYVLFARGLVHLGSGETATLTLAEPVTAALLGAVVLGERPGIVGILGAGLVLAGLVALARPGAGSPPPVAAEA